MKLKPKMPHFQGAKNYKEDRRLTAEYCARSGSPLLRKLPLSGRRRAVAWKRYDRGIPLHKAEFRYLKSAYLEEWAAELGPY